MARTANCDRDSLRRLLDGKLSSALETEVALHLETCHSCRQQLESFAADESWWNSTRSNLAGVQAGIERAALDDVGEPFESTQHPLPLDFLSPSDNPAMLGRLGEFEILERIGSGGMGIVLKGYDHELNRYVAVKVLHPHCATSAAARRRFAREAQAAAAVVHQHVVPIYAVDGQHHPPYLVMPFVPGESLQQRLTRQGPLDVVDVLRIGQQVAEGLAAAHAQGLVHRDIKPANILLERNVERVLLTDFGLARAADDASLTQSGVIAGTPQFMSPEQTRGEQVDHLTDLFSLGTVMYTLLAGHSPFRAETAMGVLRRVCDDTPRSLCEISAGVPNWLDAFIAKLQAKQPSQRFSSAAEVADLLKQCVAHVQQPTQGRLPIQVVALTSDHSIRRFTVPVRMIGSALTMVILVTLLFLMARFLERPQPFEKTSEQSVAAEPNANGESVWTDGHEQEADEIRAVLQRLESLPLDHF
ncbi:serine/threonine-protein kinase [Schlesneria paludicola]|uniref:serine/threonine-protein kinase n=1 Tax=Schlesneria paludicola TaxID=360056 RepID=UPI00029B13D7|nr:serine/threonine-protein kinase [Schlesneria paludicola]